MASLNENAAMSFDEIGAALGISRQNAVNAYMNGIKKLKRQPEALQRLQALSNERQRLIATNPEDK